MEEGTKRSTNLGELSADCTGLLWPEINREVLLALVELAQVLALLRVHNSQDASDRLADTITNGQGVCKGRNGQEVIYDSGGEDYTNG